MDRERFLHNLSVNIAALTYDQARLGNMVLAREEVDHLSQSFREVLNRMMDWNREVTKLPVFKGYTVDERLKEFRRVIMHDEGPSMEFTSFDSPKGQELLSEYRKQNSTIE